MSADVVPVAWLKLGPYDEGEPLTCVFEDPQDADCYTALCPIDTLQSRIAELEADAARDQWLRGCVPGSAYRIIGVIYSEGGAGVDAANDAAMEAGK